MISLLLIISLVYFILIIWLIIGFDKLKEFNAEQNNIKTKFSIIIPFRNELYNLSELIKSLNKIDYPNNCFEILFVDDDSTDNSVTIILNDIKKELDYQILKNIRKTNSPKKDALDLAIKKAKHQWIITTDADCEVPVKWLEVLNGFIVKNEAVFIAMPVGYKAKDNLLEQFQKIDFMSLMASTIGSFGNKKPMMCNGANLCYLKSVFKEVNGFENNQHIASGDDVFLMEKIHKTFPHKVHYLKSDKVIVYTKPEKILSGLLQQRIRWASKSGKTTNNLVKVVGLVVFGINLLMSVFIIYSIASSFGDSTINYYTFLAVFGFKITLDYILINRCYVFYKEKLNIKYYLFTVILHPFFMSVIPLLSVFTKYNWKGRCFKV